MRRLKRGAYGLLAALLLVGLSFLPGLFLGGPPPESPDRPPPDGIVLNAAGGAAPPGTTVSAVGGVRGAAILAVVIVAGSLNAIWLSLYNLSDPAVSNAAWTYHLPRILHDLFALYGIVFWIWAVVDAYKVAKTPYEKGTEVF